jgi:hypothetical protein
MFQKSLLFFSIFLFNSVCFADDSICNKLASIAESSSGTSFHPPAEAKVIANGKIRLYSAPNTNCEIKDVHIPKGSYLPVYQSYRGWINVMYIAKDGKDFIGWLPDNKAKIIGQYGQYH